MSSSRRLRRIIVRSVVGVGLALLAAAGLATVSHPVAAADRGAGFGSWAPYSTYGWHGSILIGGVYTFCILPGAPAPTDQSVDLGIDAAAAGLSPQQLTGINLLVTKYGQTADPVQAAAVGWAVKTIANRNAALHHWGYRGDSLEEAIHWTFSALAPEYDQAVQRLAGAYYAEATSVAPGPADASGTIALTTDAVDPLAGTVTVTSSVSWARGRLELDHAVFADTGTPALDGAEPGRAYAIRAVAGDAASVTVTVRGDFEGGFLAAVHHFATPGQQDTAGPAGTARFHVEATDAAPRVLVFAPTLTTQVASAYTEDAPFVDTVTFAAQGWPHTADGAYAVLTATATVYRTDAAATSPTPEIPADAKPVATMTLATDPAAGPTVAYQAATPDALPGPGAYTAVWEIRAEGQAADTATALGEGYAWQEPFGEPAQTTVWTAVSSRAEPAVTVGGTMSDTVVVGPGVPGGGLLVSTSVYRAADGAAPESACTLDALVWQSDSAAVAAPGETVFTAPLVPDFGTYYWRERATDATGVVVHEGPCGIASETSTAAVPTVSSRADATGLVAGAVGDTAVVEGAIPASGATDVVFEVYRASDGVAPADACTPETLVRSTESSPVAVAAAGDHASPKVLLEEPGTYYWIETLRWTPPGAAAPLVLARGACGVDTETTVVAAPAVSTDATDAASLGETYTDTATITGLAPDAHAELMFLVYSEAADGVPACTAETLETTTAAVPVTGDGEYVSPPVRSTRAGVKHWVALLTFTTAHGESIVLHRGACDDEHEQTRITALAVTGAATPVVPVAAVGSAAVGAGVLLALLHRRRRRFGARPTSG